MGWFYVSLLVIGAVVSGMLFLQGDDDGQNR